MSLLNITRIGNILSLALKSNGYFLSDWMKLLQKDGYEISEDAWNLLGRAVFNPTPAGATYLIEILCGTGVPDESRNINWVRANGTGSSSMETHPEVAFLLRTSLTPDIMARYDMDCAIVMHQPIQTIRGEILPGLLDIRNLGDVRRLGAFTKPYDYTLNPRTGFVFETIMF